MRVTRHIPAIAATTVLAVAGLAPTVSAAPAHHHVVDETAVTVDLPVGVTYDLATIDDVVAIAATDESFAALVDPDTGRYVIFGDDVLDALAAGEIVGFEDASVTSKDDHAAGDGANLLNNLVSSLDNLNTNISSLLNAINGGQVDLAALADNSATPNGNTATTPRDNAAAAAAPTNTQQTRGGLSSNNGSSLFDNLAGLFGNRGSSTAPAANNAPANNSPVTVTTPDGQTTTVPDAKDATENPAQVTPASNTQPLKLAGDLSDGNGGTVHIDMTVTPSETANSNGNEATQPSDTTAKGDSPAAIVTPSGTTNADTTATATPNGNGATNTAEGNAAATNTGNTNGTGNTAATTGAKETSTPDAVAENVEKRTVPTTENNTAKQGTGGGSAAASGAGAAPTATNQPAATTDGAPEEQAAAQPAPAQQPGGAAAPAQQTGDTTYYAQSADQLPVTGVNARVGLIVAALLAAAGAVVLASGRRKA